MDQLTYSIPDVSAKTGLGKTTVYKAISEGRLKARKLGNRTLILASELESFLASLPTIQILNTLTPDGGKQ